MAHIDPELLDCKAVSRIESILVYTMTIMGRLTGRYRQVSPMMSDSRYF